MGLIIWSMWKLDMEQAEKNKISLKILIKMDFYVDSRLKSRNNFLKNLNFFYKECYLKIK